LTLFRELCSWLSKKIGEMASSRDLLPGSSKKYLIVALPFNGTQFNEFFSSFRQAVSRNPATPTAFGRFERITLTSKSA